MIALLLCLASLVRPEPLPRNDSVPSSQASAIADSRPANARLKTTAITLKGSDDRELAADECRLRVPRHHAQPEDESFELAFVRVKSTSSASKALTIFLAGGPGQSGAAVARDPEQLAQWSEVLAVSDVVFLDSRGIGASTPRFDVPPATSVELPREFFADFELARELVLKSQREAQARLDALGFDATAFDTHECADDVDAVRAALGFDSMQLVAFSYGTVLAQEVVRRHEERVSRVVLVGTEGPRDWGSLPSVLDAQTRKIASLAARDENVNHAVPDFRALLVKTLETLEREPLVVKVVDRITKQEVELALGRWGLEYLLRIDLGDGNDIPLFPALVVSIAEGRTDVVARLLAKRYHPLRHGTTSGAAQAMRFAYGPSPLRRAQIDTEKDAAPFLAMHNYFDLDVASVWNVPLHDESFRAPIVTDVPALFVSGTLDVNTPPHQAEFVRSGFSRSVHLVIEHAGHEDMLPHPQVRRVVATFLADGDVSGERLALPAPRFVRVARER